MNILRTRNVHDALPMALWAIAHHSTERSSRNGLVLQAVDPVTTLYERPLERVMFWSERDANPFFHFAESMWMLAGRRDVGSMTRFAANMRNYSDDDQTFYGTYGYRWRVGDPDSEQSKLPRCDQLSIIANRLRNDKDDRRCVLSMWDRRSDLDHNGKDVPCNTNATLQINAAGELDLGVFCRSNDILWGCYGANAVHFSYLLEYMAARCGVNPGRYWQISMNWHAYRMTYDPLVQKMEQWIGKSTPSPYEEDTADAPVPFPLAQSATPEQWDQNVLRLTAAGGRCPVDGVWHDPFFPDVAMPILRSHDLYKDGTDENKFENALREIEKCQATDWRRACREWLIRRWDRFRGDHASI